MNSIRSTRYIKGLVKVRVATLVVTLTDASETLLVFSRNGNARRPGTVQ